MCSSGFASKYDKRELQARYSFNESFVVDRVLVNIDAAPYATVISANRDNAKGRLNAFQMLDPEVICWWLPNHRGLSGLFSISALRFDFVRAIGDIQTAEYLLEFCYIGHLISLSEGGGGVASP